MEICNECGAAGHGNLFCNTCRTINNERYGYSLPPWHHPAEKPCGVKEVQDFINRLNKFNEKESD